MPCMCFEFNHVFRHISFMQLVFACLTTITLAGVLMSTTLVSLTPQSLSLLLPALPTWWLLMLRPTLVTKSTRRFWGRWLRPSQKSLITSRVSTIEFDVTSISTNSAPMSSSGSVRLSYKKCLEVWGNAKQKDFLNVN